MTKATYRYLFWHYSVIVWINGQPLCAGNFQNLNQCYKFIERDSKLYQEFGTAYTIRNNISEVLR